MFTQRCGLASSGERHSATSGPSQRSRRSRMRGCEGRLRSSMSSKRRTTCRGTRRLLPFGSSTPSGTLTGQPAGLAAATPSPIRASPRARHEPRNRSTSSSFNYSRSRADSVTHRPIRTPPQGPLSPASEFVHRSLHPARLPPCALPSRVAPASSGLPHTAAIPETD